MDSEDVISIVLNIVKNNYWLWVFKNINCENSWC